MARILLSAYACEPGRGSEPGVGWNWATELARLGHQVTVVTRTSNRSTIERCAVSPSENLTFLYYDLPRRLQAWRKYPGGKRVYYLLWQWFVVPWLRLQFHSTSFDFVQHVTYVSARYPSFMGALGIPVLFGPVSGGERVPARLRAGFSVPQFCREWVRDLSNFLVPFDPFLRHTFRQASQILVTRDTLPLVPRRWREKCSIHLAIGLAANVFHPPPREHIHGPCSLRLLYVGRLLDWKGIHLALLAMARIAQQLPDARFTIVGEGPAKARLTSLCERLGLARSVRWCGWVPQKNLAEHYRAADLLLFPSLRDSGGTVVLEALSCGLPVLCTDLGGPGFMVNATCGRTAPTLGRSPDQVACYLAEALLEIGSTPGLLSSLSHGATVRARAFAFENLVRSLYPAVAARLARKA